MRRCWLSTAVVFVLVFPCVAADAWGSAVNGVRMGIAIGSGSNPEIQVTVRNVDDKPLLLHFGALVDAGLYDFGFRVVLNVDGKDRRVIFTGGPGAVGGRVDPLVLPLVPNASYTVRIPFALLYVLDGSEKLERFVSKRCQIRIELDVQNPTCPLYGYPNPNMIPCWQGKVVSNVLQLPN